MGASLRVNILFCLGGIERPGFFPISQLIQHCILLWHLAFHFLLRFDRMLDPSTSNVNLMKCAMGRASTSIRQHKRLPYCRWQGGGAVVMREWLVHAAAILGRHFVL